MVTDRTVLDAQLQATISGFDHTLGAVETIGEDKSSKDLRDALNNGVRIIVTTLQKFPVIYQEVDKVAGRNYAIIVDEAHSSQTGNSALKLKTALADTEEALREYAEMEGKAEAELDPDDINLLPVEVVDMVDLEGKLKLEYYKLQKTFEGAIQLEEQKGVYEPAKHKGAMGFDAKEPLDEIIEKINEKFKGAFTDGDRVLLTALRDKLMGDTKLASMARTSDPQIFVESIFPKAFGDAAMESYTESQDTYTSLFEDQSKYNAIMSALAEVVYREMRKKK